MIIKKVISEKNEESWTIFTDKFYSNLLIEPKIENIKVYTTVKNVKFTKLFSKNFNIGDCVSIVVSKKSKLEVEHKGDCLVVSPTWSDVIVNNVLPTVEIGSKFSKIIIQSEIKNIALNPTIRNLKISNQVNDITFEKLCSRNIQVDSIRKAVKFNGNNIPFCGKKVLTLVPIIENFEIHPVVNSINILKHPTNNNHQTSL